MLFREEITLQFYYGDKMPLRILDEGEFWKLQEAEHTDVIQALVPNLEPQFVQALKSWEQALSRTQATFVEYIETIVRSGQNLNPHFHTQVMQLVQFAAQQSKQFVSFLNQLGTESQALKQNATAIVVLNHIRRESEYFIGISNALLYNQ
jgi:hypothetical protein